MLITLLPQDAHQALLIGRLWVPDLGPVVCAVTPGDVFDLSQLAPTSSQLLELPEVAHQVRAYVRSGQAPRLASTPEALANSDETSRDASQTWFMAPCDLQAVKAAGVTFVASMLERVIEEQARGDASRAEAVRQAVVAVIGDNLRSVVPGSPESARLKEVLLAQGMWSQYLEVGIGPDAEIFTKAQPMSAVGPGARVGIHPGSQWNNPEPEIVLAANSRGAVVGASLGNDVNLRDFEGRSALLLGKAKDNNASCAIGPFIRLFDEHFGIDDVRQCVLNLKVEGPEGFVQQRPEPDQPRPARFGGSGHGQVPPVPRRHAAVFGHHVRPHPRPPWPRTGLYPCGGRCGQHLHPAAGHLGQPGQHLGPGTRLDLWCGRADA